MKPEERLIVALDVDSYDGAMAFSEQVGMDVSWFKVGLELFTTCGPEILRALRSNSHSGMKLMLDLKLHDIPETVARTVARIADEGVRMTTLHTSGGPMMMKMAAKARAGSGLKLLGVTVLTSMDAADLCATMGQGSRLDRASLVQDTAIKRACLAVECGLDGVVASPHEAAAIRAGVPPEFLIVTPGIRPLGNDVQDQKRVSTPSAARKEGADYIVVGRPIRDAADPGAAARAIIAELETVG